MSDSLDTLLARRDELQRMMDTAAERVRRGDSDTWFRKQNEMSAQLADLDRRIGQLQNAARPIRRAYITGGKGL